jgi:LAS superfamily LD-carboxypeptidase LdcB
LFHGFRQFIAHVMTHFATRSTTQASHEADVASARMPEVGRKAALEESFKALESYIEGGGLLKNGASGDPVAGLHRALNEIYGQPHFRKVGSFGNYTDNLVERFQREHKLKPDGVVGPKTLEALRKELAKATGGELPARAQAKVPETAASPEPVARERTAQTAIAQESIGQTPVPEQDRAAWVVQASALAQAERVVPAVPTASAQVERVSHQAVSIGGQEYRTTIENGFVAIPGSQHGRAAKLELVELGKNLKLVPEAAAAFVELQEKAYAAGLGTIGSKSSFRSTEEQTSLIRRHQADPTQPAADPVSVSEHCRGKAVDTTWRGTDLAWLKKNAAEVGFKFPHSDEPWHLEYVARPNSGPRLQFAGRRNGRES